MTKTILLLTSILFISACSSPPKAKEPSGDWVQINNSHYYEENAKPTQQK
ncbi:hypothetical protein [Lonepinella sp. BR2882]